MRSPVHQYRELTPEDVRLLDLLADGMTDREIAEEVGSQQRYVAADVDRLMRRLGAVNRAHLVRRAVAQKVIPA